MPIAKAVLETAVAKPTFIKSSQYPQTCKENNIIVWDSIGHYLKWSLLKGTLLRERR